MAQEVEHKKAGRKTRKDLIREGDAENGTRTKKVINHNRETMHLGYNSVDMHDPVSIRKRLRQYLDLCLENEMKPSTAGLALAFGMSRMNMLRYLKGNVRLPDECMQVFVQMDALLNANAEENLQENNINPVAGIFLLKNNQGYKDTTDIVVNPSTAFGDDVPVDDLKRRYLDSIAYVDKTAEGAEDEVQQIGPPETDHWDKDKVLFSKDKPQPPKQPIKVVIESTDEVKG